MSFARDVKVVRTNVEAGVINDVDLGVIRGFDPL
jgi:hypothetical protein